MKNLSKKKQLHYLGNKIKRRLRKHLNDLGFQTLPNGKLKPPSNNKDTLRKVHEKHRTDRLIEESEFVKTHQNRLIKYFASGNEIDPHKISPRLQLIAPDTLESDLFRFASLTWSIPVSRGYGRRLRFLIWDDFNDKIIGLFALGDPVFNSRIRDNFIGWTAKQREDRLVNCLDAYVLGAVPPYSMLLCGKLVACLIRSKEVCSVFNSKYGNSTGIISGKKKKATLTLATTSSALGKSSVYNRLKLNGITYFEPIGFTEGWGHFHIPSSLFEDMRNYLALNKHEYAKGHQFGSGPNWRMRVVRTCLELMGQNADVLHHGIYREVYVCKIADNATSILKGKSLRPQHKTLLGVNEVAKLALERWVIPRSQRRPEFLYWKREQLLELLNPQKTNLAASESTLTFQNADLHNKQILNSIKTNFDETLLAEAAS